MKLYPRSSLVTINEDWLFGQHALICLLKKQSSRWCVKRFFSSMFLKYLCYNSLFSTTIITRHQSIIYRKIIIQSYSLSRIWRTRSKVSPTKSAEINSAPHSKKRSKCGKTRVSWPSVNQTMTMLTFWSISKGVTIATVTRSTVKGEHWPTHSTLTLTEESLVTRILIAKKTGRLEVAGAPILNGWLYTSLDTVWGWAIPAPGEVSCTRGTQDIDRISNFMTTIKEEYMPSMVSNNTIYYFKYFVSIFTNYIYILLILFFFLHASSVLWSLISLNCSRSKQIPLIKLYFH